jgi:hypothetical protein
MTQPSCEPSSDAAFATSHETDEDDVGVHGNDPTSRRAGGHERMAVRYRKIGKGELKWLETLQGYKVTRLQSYKVTRLQGYKVEPETAEPEFERVPSRSLLIMARLGEWNECQLPALCNVLTLQRF